MRLLAALAALGCVCSVFGQKLSGTYKSSGADPVSWNVNSHETLMWGAAPYLPVGLEIDGNSAAVAAAKATGVSDVVVDLPADGGGWSETIAALESAHMRYLVRVSSLTPMAQGVAVDPAGYRIADVKKSRHLDLALPGATSALVLVAQSRDGSIIKWGQVPVIQGRLSYDVQVPASLEAVVLVYPTESSLEQPDFWEGLDGQRDRLLRTLKQNPTGAGLRGFINPIGKTLALPGKDLRFVPQSAGFRSEYGTFLENRYRNVVGVLRSWSLPTDLISSNETGEDPKAILTFDDLASLIPLWSGSRGVGQMYDPHRNLIYSCDQSHSAYWKDLAAFVSAAESRRVQRLVASIREVDDVPVVQEWAGWASIYEGSPCVDGVGIKAKGGSPSVILSTAGKAASSDLRWTAPGWLAATDIDLDAADASPQIGPIVEDLTSLGARGIFFHAKTPEQMKAVALEAVAKASDTSPSQGSPAPIYFPENATNPAEVQRLAGGFWWLPAPFDGERIDYGDHFFAYRMRTPKGVSLTMWTDHPQRVLLHILNSKKLEATALSGANPDLKQAKGGVEITLTDAPLVLTNLDEVPVPEPAYEQTLTEILVLMKQAQDSHRDLTEATMMISEAKQGFERNPGGEFLQLRKLLHQLDSFMGRFTWAEMEATADTNFSEVVDAPGCSNNRTLNLRPLIDSPTGYYAAYDVPIHTTQDEDVWLAAKISPEDRPYVSLDVNGQHLNISGDPIGLYGSGFGWYRMGTTRNGLGGARLKLLVSNPSADIAADAVLLAPPGYQPSGLRYPEIEVATSEKSNLKKPRRKRSSR